MGFGLTPPPASNLNSGSVIYTSSVKIRTQGLREILIIQGPKLLSSPSTGPLHLNCKILYRGGDLLAVVDVHLLEYVVEVTVGDGVVLPDHSYAPPRAP